jgi:hypothetical protein
MRRGLLVCLIFSLLVLALPAFVAADLLTAAPDGASEPVPAALGRVKNDRARQAIALAATAAPDQEDPDEEPGSEQAIRVRERIESARACGIPPGHLNLIDRLAGLSGKTRQELVDAFKAGDLTVQDLARQRQALRQKKPDAPDGDGEAEQGPPSEAGQGRALGRAGKTHKNGKPG